VRGWVRPWLLDRSGSPSARCRLVVGVSGQGKPSRQPRSGAVGQWAGAVGIVRRGRRSPERVWTLRALPLESLPTALTVKGAGGEKQPGRTPTLVLSVSGWLLFRKAARALCGLLIHEPPRSSWATRPPPQPMRASEGDGWRDNKNHSRRLRRHPAAANSQGSNSQGKTNSPRAKGPRAQEPRREPGGEKQPGRTPT